METADRELILKVMHSNAKLKRLYEEHLHFEMKLDELGRKKFLTTEEEIEEKKLKKLKLLGVDKMMILVNAKVSKAHTTVLNSAGKKSSSERSQIIQSEVTV